MNRTNQFILIIINLLIIQSFKLYSSTHLAPGGIREIEITIFESTKQAKWNEESVIKYIGEHYAEVGSS